MIRAGEHGGALYGTACATIRAWRGPRVEIEYCTGCRFLTRAAWLAQELLTTFEDELEEVALVPGSGGILEVRSTANRLVAGARTAPPSTPR